MEKSECIMYLMMYVQMEWSVLIQVFFFHHLFVSTSVHSQSSDWLLKQLIYTII